MVDKRTKAQVKRDAAAKNAAEQVRDAVQATLSALATTRAA